MRKPNYLSPSAINKYKEDKNEFYWMYLCEERPPRMPQTQPMSIGSAFDAYVKSFLHEKLFGKGNDPRFEFETIFTAQVESQHRDWARKHGAFAFTCYKESGALYDLMLELQSAIGTPKFEIEVSGVVNGFREGVTKSYLGVTFLGKPDVFYINKEGVQVILDHKVSGWCGKYTTSPKRGYVKLRSTTGVNIGCHKDAMPQFYKGSTINIAFNLESVDQDWARQLCIYSWLCGLEIGDECIAAIDQLACSYTALEFPSVRIAEHRTRIGKDFQWQTFAEAQEIWDIVQSEHYFRDVSLEESKERCRALDAQARIMKGQGSSEDAWFLNASRS